MVTLNTAPFMSIDFVIMLTKVDKNYLIIKLSYEKGRLEIEAQTTCVKLNHEQGS